jgi:hypothetical protein
MKSAAIGILIHYFISLLIVAVYYAASRRIPALRKRPFLFGPLYGIGVWIVMNDFVLPYSRAGAGAHTASAVANGLFIHAFGIGLIAALFAGFAPPSVTANRDS